MVQSLHLKLVIAVPMHEQAPDIKNQFVTKEEESNQTYSQNVNPSF
jgi:hypothetical protein